jgi:glycosyltransferase involved in cell wall biosynthesis
MPQRPRGPRSYAPAGDGRGVAPEVRGAMTDVTAAPPWRHSPVGRLQHEQLVPSDPESGAACTLWAIASASGLERVRVVAWRDLEHPEAGGSELHAHRIASLWAAAGIDVEIRTSEVPGGERVVHRAGYRVVRRGGRYGVFARVGIEGLLRRRTTGEALVEIWNGMPFWSPLWSRAPHVVFLHHVHAEMWRMALPPWVARIGELIERRVAPPLYGSTRVITLSQSSRAEIIDMLGFRPGNVTVIPPGVERRFSPGTPDGCSPFPLVVAVGRLVPVKRFDLLMRALTRAKAREPSLRAVIAGEGYERPRLELLRRSLGATAWISLPGRVRDDEVVDLYRRAWVVASTSQREGWGMTLTEAGACGTPAVASDIVGHRDAVVHGQTGLLADGEEGLAAAITRVLGDHALRARLSAGALAHARRFTWEAAAQETLEVVAEAACAVGGTYSSSGGAGAGAVA